MSISNQYQRLRTYLHEGSYPRHFWPAFEWMESCPEDLGQEAGITTAQELAEALPGDNFVWIDAVMTAWELFISQARHTPGFKLHEEWFYLVRNIREAVAQRLDLPPMPELTLGRTAIVWDWRQWGWYPYEGTDATIPKQWEGSLTLLLERNLEEEERLSDLIAQQEHSQTRILPDGFMGDTNERYETYFVMPFPFYELGWVEWRLMHALNDLFGMNFVEPGQQWTPDDWEQIIEMEILPIIEVFSDLVAAIKVKADAMENPKLDLTKARPISRLATEYRAEFINRWIDLVLCRYPIRGGVQEIEFPET